MERYSDKAIEIINDLHTERLDYASEYIPLIDAAQQLAAYEDTGLAPEEVQQMRWIPVEERLPEEQGQYIVFVDGKVTTDFYWVCEDIKWWLSYNGGFNALYIDPYSSKPKREPPYPRVTHWMPLPPSPPAKGEK